MVRVAGAALAALLFAAPVCAQPLSYPLTIAGGGLTGAGGDVLKGEIAKSDFVLFGEDHGFADSPVLLAALARDAKPAGFDHYVIEVGPLSTQRFVDTLAHGGIGAFQKIVHRYPLAYPFLANREDAETAAMFAAPDANGQPRLWGIDQEFIGAPALLLEDLAVAAPNAAARETAEALLTREREAAAKADQAHFFLFTETEAAFDALSAQFAGSAKGQAIIAAFRRSAHIYQLYNADKNYLSNAERSTLLVQSFLDAYNAAGKPKTIFRMGAEHVGLGLTTNNTFDPGTLTSSLAAANGKKALRVLFLPMGGRYLHIAPAAGNPFKVDDYDDADVKDFFASIGADAAALPKDSWSLIPLEPVRQTLETRGINKLKPMTRFFLLGYDYVITTPNAKPATSFY
jgi:hypothetical protein